MHKISYLTIFPLYPSCLHYPYDDISTIKALCSSLWIFVQMEKDETDHETVGLVEYTYRSFKHEFTRQRDEIPFQRCPRDLPWDSWSFAFTADIGQTYNCRRLHFYREIPLTGER